MIFNPTLKRCLSPLVVSSLVFASSAVFSGDDASMPIALSFEGQFAGKAFSCDGEFMQTGLSAAAVTVSEYKLYVSRVRMLTSAGEEIPVTLTPDGLWQQEDVALLDFENAQDNCSNGTAPTNTRVIGTVPEG